MGGTVDSSTPRNEAVASRGVEHGDDRAMSAVRTSRPAPWASNAADGGRSTREKAPPPARSRRAWSSGSSGRGRGACRSSRATGPGPGCPPPARSPWWRTGRRSRRKRTPRAGGSSGDRPATTPCRGARAPTPPPPLRSPACREQGQGPSAGRLQQLGQLLVQRLLRSRRGGRAGGGPRRAGRAAVVEGAPDVELFVGERSEPDPFDDPGRDGGAGQDRCDLAPEHGGEHGTDVNGGEAQPDVASRPVDPGDLAVTAGLEPVQVLRQSTAACNVRACGWRGRGRVRTPRPP